MPYRTKIKRVCRPFLMGALLSAGLLIWLAPNHRPSLGDFVVVVLLGLLFTTCLSVFNGIHAGINVVVFCIFLGVAQPLFQQWKAIFPFGSMYIALIVSYIMSRSLYRFERSRLRLHCPENVRISISDQGFDVIGQMMQENNTKYKSVTWSKVYRINAFKRDLFSYDLICLEFYQENTETPVEVNEEIDGFNLLADTLPQNFKGFDEEWYSKVLKPAFATNLTEVWKRG